jgi:hypothetical protein
MPSVMAITSCEARVGGLQDRVRRERRRHEDHRRVGARWPRTACATVSKIGTLPSKKVPPLPGVTPPTTLVPYSMHCARVEGARRP